MLQGNTAGNAPAETGGKAAVTDSDLETAVLFRYHKRMKKEFLPYDTVRDNGIKLARAIYEGGFMPDVIYVSLRGGAYLGNVISEYFKVVNRRGRPVYYAAVVARSYTDVRKAGQVKVEGWTYAPEHLRTGDKVLLVDDIFDSGRTINHLAGIILEKGIPREDLRIAVHDYKFFYDKKEQFPVQPDYWCRKHELSVKGEDIWIHYMSHELMGLRVSELEEYHEGDAEVKEILRSLGRD
jgi:hypoxanthine phosphoribosyltransferase